MADRLKAIFREDRENFEKKWDDLKLFIHYGILSEPDFYDKAKPFALLRDIDGKCYTYEEYQAAVKENQTDKHGDLVCLYSNDRETQWSYIEAARAKGYNVLLLDGQLDAPLVSTLEQKWGANESTDDKKEGEKTERGYKNVRFLRVDGDTIDNLIQKDDAGKQEVDAETKHNLSTVFQAVMPQVEKTEFHVEASAMGEDGSPVVITQSEYMRRYKEMARLQQGMSFYGEMPDAYTLVLNTDHRLVKGVNTDLEQQLAEKLAPIDAELKNLRAQRDAMTAAQKDVKPEDLSEEEKNGLKQVREDITKQEGERDNVLREYAKTNHIVPQLIDLALLQNGLLKGEALSRFVKRSVELIG